MGIVNGQNRMLMENRVKFSSDLSFLTKVALGNPDSHINTLAIRKIDSESHLYDISIHSKDSFARLSAYLKLKHSENILKSYYKNGEKKSFLSKAIPYLENDPLLVDLAIKHYNDPDLYHKIVDAIKTKKSLSNLMDQLKELPPRYTYLHDYAQGRFDNLSNTIDFLLNYEEED